MLSGCASADLVVKKDFEFNQTQKIAVLGFSGMKSSSTTKLFNEELKVIGFSVVGQSPAGTAVTDPTVAQQMGKDLGVDAVVIGSALPALQNGRIVPVAKPLSPRAARAKANRPENEQFQSIPKMELSAKMIDVQSGDVLWVGTAQSEGASLEAAIAAATRALSKRLKRSFRRF